MKGKLQSDELVHAEPMASQYNNIIQVVNDGKSDHKIVVKLIFTG
jgi:hypothetical protein